MKVDPIERLNLTLGAGAVAISFALATPGFALSLGAGALLEAANFRGLQRSAQALFAGAGAARAAAFGPRFVLLAAGIGGALWAGAHPVGLLLGLTLIVPAALVQAWRTRPAIDPSASALAPDDEEWERWNAWLAREWPEREED